MSDFELVRDSVIPAAMQVLGEGLDSREARAMLLTSGLQETRFEHRRQPAGGPGRGLWQFERNGGWRGVLEHRSVSARAQAVLLRLGYSQDPGYDTLTLDDVLACCFARLLLYTHPLALPKEGENGYAWNYYLNLWRPGRPHPETWDAFYEQAWRNV